VTVEGKTTEYEAPVADGDPFSIVAGPEGALWIGAERRDVIMRARADGADFKPRP
jgi:hypothetical protein